MDRREFLKDVAWGAAAIPAAAAEGPRKWTLENRYLSWEIEAGPGGIRSTGFHNKISGRRTALDPKPEFALVFSAAKHRIEIPWWEFSPGDDEASGHWTKVQNLAGSGGGRVYDGYGRFRAEVRLPEEASGEEIVLVLGGYDQQDWNERWVYVNGVEIGHDRSQGRWRSPGQYTIRPGDAAYGKLQFGTGTNLVAVRGHGYDLHFEGISDKALERYVFRAYLFDQFVSAGSPYLRIEDFALQEAKQVSAEEALFVLVNAQHGIRVRAHYTLDGFIRRKWLEVRNDSAKELRLLDVELDNMGLAGGTSEGGHGEPVFLGNDGFCAVEHPSGVNEGRRDSVRLWHCPAHLLEPGSEYKTHATVAGAAPAGGALEQFHAYLREHSPRTAKKAISIYTTFGLNNQWGACSTLRDVEALDVEKVVKGWQAKGLKLDFFTLDTGWPDNAGDLKEFSPTCYPDGPDKLIEGVHAMGMKFGMWFSVSWGGWSCGANPAIQPSTIPYPGSSGEPPTAPPVGVYRNGYPVMGGIGTQLCVASGPFYRVFHDAILHHVTHNQARLLKFDSGNYYCNSTAHGHLPGKYSVEAMHDSLIRIAADARKAAPDVFVIWYWGLSSPLWALHGDMIFESGLFMEGSGTSWQPALHYRDSVTLSLDQNTQFAKLIPPINKDSLGVWLSQIRWGNFMGRERWREAIVMDLGRGNLVFPQMWGDPYLLNDEDVRFLAGMMSVLKANERVFLSPRKTFGDSWKNEPYGYSFFEGGHGFVFANNMHFAARKLALPRWARGASVEIISHFPEKARVEASAREIWLRPFEVAMLEIRTRSAQRTELPARPFAGPEAYGSALELAPAQAKDWMDLRFAEAARLEKSGKKKMVEHYSATLPALAAGRYVVAVPVRLRKGEEEYRYAPVVAEIIQLRAAIGGHVIQFIPVPDARQFGNTQSAGCSWVLYKVPITARQAGQPFEFAVHAYLPEGVRPVVEAWVVRQWWEENTRPQADGYYGDAPS